jgi:hypothetical protein
MRTSLDANASLPELLQELLDAHADTLRLATADLRSLEWSAHRAYLRDLRRVGLEALASLEASEHR